MFLHFVCLLSSFLFNKYVHLQMKTSNADVMLRGYKSILNTK